MLHSDDPAREKHEKVIESTKTKGDHLENPKLKINLSENSDKTWIRKDLQISFLNKR